VKAVKGVTIYDLIIHYCWKFAIDNDVDYREIYLCYCEQVER